MNSKKHFHGSNSGQTKSNLVKITNETAAKKETKPVKKTGSNFNQKAQKKVNKTNYTPIKSVNPRQLSFFILNRYFSEKSNLKFLLNEFLKKYPLSELDRRFVFEVVKGTVRYVIRIDFLISLFSNKNIKSLDKDVLNILRQAVYQILYMDKTPGYAAVYESVEIAKKHIGTYSSKFVNAVLRKINALQEIQEFLNDSIKKAFSKPAKRLSVMYSYPEWLADYWVKSYGIDKTVLLFEHLNLEPAVFIRVNRLKTDKIKLLNTFKENGMLQGRDFFTEPSTNIRIDEDSESTSGATWNFKKTGLFDDCIILKSVQNIEKIPGYLQGHFSVQDFSSQFAVKYFLCPTGHDKILDICSAPGGKATYMAELTDGKAEILSVDINAKKMDLFEENIARLGISNITILDADVTNAGFLGQDKFENYFDKIFIDAPCSALGTISKNPDAKYACALSDMERLGQISGKILSAADKYLKPGGVIVLYKCTLSEIENRETVSRFLEQNPDKYSICQPFSASSYTNGPSDSSQKINCGITDSNDVLPQNSSNDKIQHSSSPDKDFPLTKVDMLKPEFCRWPAFGEGSFFEIMPDWFSSESGFICILKKLV